MRGMFTADESYRHTHAWQLEHELSVNCAGERFEQEYGALVAR
jgi:hypothetical protein